MLGLDWNHWDMTGEGFRKLPVGALDAMTRMKMQNEISKIWKIIYGLFGEEVEEDFEQRKEFLLKHHIAVWDVLQSCDREGSSDVRIINPAANDFAALFLSYPNIRKVYFNGSKAEVLKENRMKMKSSFININKNIRKAKTMDE